MRTTIFKTDPDFTLGTQKKRVSVKTNPRQIVVIPEVLNEIGEIDWAPLARLMGKKVIVTTKLPHPRGKVCHKPYYGTLSALPQTLRYQVGLSRSTRTDLRYLLLNYVDEAGKERTQYIPEQIILKVEGDLRKLKQG